MNILKVMGNAGMSLPVQDVLILASLLLDVARVLRPSAQRFAKACV